MTETVAQDLSFGATAGRWLELTYTFAFSAAIAVAVTLDTYSESARVARLTAFLVFMLSVEALAFRRLRFTRELGLYSVFVAYMLIELLWTPDLALAANTLIPALNFTLLLIVFSTLGAYHSVRMVLAGSLFGLLCGAVLYTATQGFPFSIPDDFSYNAIAGMYLFGLVLAVMLSCYVRWRLALLPVQTLLWLLIVATTSIKTNLGIALGVAATCALYSRRFLAVLRRNFLLLAVLAVILVGAVLSNEQLQEILDRGFTRIEVGVSVLQAREDQPGYTGFQYRSTWESEGLGGWLQNPVFGYGVEAFRNDFGITSHSTPVDLLYNSGLIGLGLFYALFLSLVLRLLELRSTDVGPVEAVIFGALVCYGFITLSAPMHYNSYLGVFLGLSSQVLARYRQMGLHRA